MVLVGKCKLHQPLSLKMGVIQYALLFNNGDAFFFKKIYMTLAHTVDYNVCKIYFVSFTHHENNAIGTTPFRKIDKKQIYLRYS